MPVKSAVQATALVVFIGASLVLAIQSQTTDVKPPLTLIAKWRATERLGPFSVYPDDNPAEMVYVPWNVMGESGTFRPNAENVGPSHTGREWVFTATFDDYDGSPANMRITMPNQPHRKVACQMKIGQKTLDIGEDLHTIGCSNPPPAPGTRT